MSDYKLHLTHVKDDYINDLLKADNKVGLNKNSTRPYVGILFLINKYIYFAPLSSPKPKHQHMKNQIDFIKIDNGKLGAINLNNMIPIPSLDYTTMISLNITSNMTSFQLKYINLLIDQLKWINNNKNFIINNAQDLYNDFMNNKLDKYVESRCCEFDLLEKVCDKHIEQMKKEIEDELER